MWNLDDLERVYLKQIRPSFLALTSQTRDVFASQPCRPRPFLFWDSPYHGVGHFARVGCLALALYERRRERSVLAGRTPDGPTPSETVEALVLSAFFHDSGRINENRDRGHGPAGEQIFRAFASRVVPAPKPSVCAVVSAAILYHCGGGVGSPDGVATAVANADRLDRIRFGDRPVPRLMCDDEGAWKDFEPLARDFVDLVSTARVLEDVGPNPAG
jgi:hypothetical protein